MKAVLHVVKSVKKALDILQLLSDSPENSMVLGDIADKVGINKSTCAHILDTLCDSLFVERISRKSGYRLGAGTYMLTRFGRYQEKLIEIASPVLRWLRSQVDATVFLTVVCDGTKYIIFHIDGAKPLDIRNSEIIRGNIETTASGLLMMAYMDADSLNRVAQRRALTGVDMTDVTADQEDKLKKIRRNGYAHIFSEENASSAYAFRVFDGNRTVAAVGVLYAAQKDSDVMRAIVVKKGQAAASEISRRLMFD